MGRWRSVCQSSSREVQTVVLDLFLSGLPVTPCAGFSASALRRCAFVRGTVPVSGDRYLPHQRRCVAHAGRAVPARALEAVCLPHGAPVFVGGREPKVSRPWSRQSPPPTGLRCQTASKAIPSAALRGLVGLETLALGPAARSSTIPTTSPAPVTRPRDSKPTRSTRNPRSRGSAYGSGVPRSGDGNCYIYLPHWAAACAAAFFLPGGVVFVSVPRVEKIFIFSAKVLKINLLLSLFFTIL